MRVEPAALVAEVARRGARLEVAAGEARVVARCWAHSHLAL